MIHGEEINGAADSPKAPTSAVPDRSEIGPYLGGLRGRNAGLATNWPNSVELRREGDVSDSAMSAVPDRSEIDPYLGGLRGRNADLATGRPNSGELWG